jgi:hypothetical protein
MRPEELRRGIRPIFGQIALAENRFDLWLERHDDVNQILIGHADSLVSAASGDCQCK